MKKLLPFLLLMTLPAHADEAIALKEKIVVGSNAITLNDMLQTPAQQGGVVLFGAPSPGESGVISVARAVTAAKSYGVNAVAPPKLDEIAVEREARRIPTSDIEATIAARAAEQLHVNVNDVDVSLSIPHLERAVEKELKEALSVAAFRLEPQSGRFEARLFVPGSEVMGQDAPAIVTGTITRTAEVVQLKQPLARGQVITGSDVELVRVRHQQVNANMLRHLDQAIGMAAKRSLYEDAMLRDNDLEKAKIVDRNDIVLIMYETPSMTVTTRGKALGHGAIGDVIDVLNIQSKHTVQATVIGDGKVAVGNSLPARRMTAQKE